jgi:hypothetical protein
MANENATLPIPNAVLEPYIKAAVAASISGILGNGDEIVRKIVDHAMQQKVNDVGVVSRNSYENNQSFIEFLASSEIHKIARSAMNEMVAEMRPQIKTQIKRLISLRKDQIAEGLLNGLSAESGVQFDLTINGKPISTSRYPIFGQDDEDDDN